MRLGLIGYGSIARTLLDRLPKAVSQVTVLVRRMPEDAGPGLRFVTEVADLIGASDCVVECAGHGAVAAHGEAILHAGRDLIIASIGALADAGLHDRLTGAGPGRLILPSGAIGGLDLLRALALSGPVRVTYEGTKPPAAWAGTPADEAGDLATLTAPLTVFEGGAREAARLFPKNSNVVAALALSGPGFDAVSVRLIADPAARGNAHRYTVTAEGCRASVEIEATPSSGNARTSQTTVFSLLSEIEAIAQGR